MLRELNKILEGIPRDVRVLIKPEGICKAVGRRVNNITPEQGFA